MENVKNYGNILWTTIKRLSKGSSDSIDSTTTTCSSSVEQILIHSEYLLSKIDSVISWKDPQETLTAILTFHVLYIVFIFTIFASPISTICWTLTFAYVYSRWVTDIWPEIALDSSVTAATTSKGLVTSSNETTNAKVVCEKWNSMRRKMTSFVDMMSRLRANNHELFCIVTSSTCLIVAKVGSYFSLLTTIYLTVMTTFLAPILVKSLNESKFGKSTLSLYETKKGHVDRMAYASDGDDKVDSTTTSVMMFSQSSSASSRPVFAVCSVAASLLYGLDCLKLRFMSQVYPKSTSPEYAEGFAFKKSSSVNVNEHEEEDACGTSEESEGEFDTVEGGRLVMTVAQEEICSSFVDEDSMNKQLFQTHSHTDVTETDEQAHSSIIISEEHQNPETHEKEESNEASIKSKVLEQSGSVCLQQGVEGMMSIVTEKLSLESNELTTDFGGCSGEMINTKSKKHSTTSLHSVELTPEETSPVHRSSPTALSSLSESPDSHHSSDEFLFAVTTTSQRGDRTLDFESSQNEKQEEKAAALLDLNIETRCFKATESSESPTGSTKSEELRVNLQQAIEDDYVAGATSGLNIVADDITRVDHGHFTATLAEKLSSSDDFPDVSSAIDSSSSSCDSYEHISTQDLPSSTNATCDEKGE